MLSAKQQGDRKVESDAVGFVDKLEELEPEEKDALQEEENAAQGGVTTSTIEKPLPKSYVMLFLTALTNLVGNGFFVLGVAAGNVNNISLIWQILLLASVTVFCIYLLMDLFCFYDSNDLMHLVGCVIGCANKFVAVLLYFTDVSALLYLFIVLKNHSAELLLVFGVAGSFYSNWAFSTVVIIVTVGILLLMELYSDHLRRTSKQRVIIQNNNMTITDSHIDQLNALNGSIVQNNIPDTVLKFGKVFLALLGLTIIYVLLLFVKLIAISFDQSNNAAATLLNTTNVSANLGESRSIMHPVHMWLTTPVIMFIFSSSVLMLIMNEQTQSCIEASFKKKRFPNLLVGVFLPSVIVFVLMKLMSLSDGIHIWYQLHAAEHIFVILMCILAMSLKLLPAAKVCERILCHECNDGKKWIVLLYVLLLGPAALFSLFIEQEECVIYFAGSTLLPILIWILPCALYVLHIRKWRNAGQDGLVIAWTKILKIAICCIILLGAMVFCSLHLSKIAEVFANGLAVHS